MSSNPARVKVDMEAVQRYLDAKIDMGKVPFTHICNHEWQETDGWEDWLQCPHCEYWKRPWA